ncbi:MAG: ATP-binding domain-containing protein, partial [Leptospiraceae bacterium]|nr:ATP-binding domain-containing protein [Leptospiraceae bacterium]
EDVTVLLPEEEGHSLLTRELLYTAITRAKKSAILISSESVLKSSIENQIIRETGFSVWENS